jgi:hypothetical protein
LKLLPTNGAKVKGLGSRLFACHRVLPEPVMGVATCIQYTQTSQAVPDGYCGSATAWVAQVPRLRRRSLGVPYKIRLSPAFQNFAF